MLLNGDSIYHTAVDVIELRKRMGMVFQKPNPFPMSIYENVVYSLRIDGERDRSMLDEVCERSLRGAALWDEVKDGLHESALRLSGGQQQRLCIARAIAAEPEVLLLDEPCSALDPIATGKIEDLIQELRGSVFGADRHAQHAASLAHQRLHGVHVPGPPDRIRPDARYFHQADAQGDRRLRDRPVWLMLEFIRELAIDRFRIDMTKHIQRQIEVLKQKILYVGTLVEEAIAKAIAALINRDASLANKVIEADNVIDRMEVDVEEECLKILALYQPVAADLRFVVAVLKINNDLERMGDLAQNIAKRVVYLAKADPMDLAIDFRSMAAKAQTMVKQSLDALVNADTALARQVRAEDDEVDQARQRIRKQIMEAIRKHPDRVEYLLKFNSVSKHLERLADMATNVAEDVIYMVEGEIVRHRHGEEQE